MIFLLTLFVFADTNFDPNTAAAQAIQNAADLRERQRASANELIEKYNIYKKSSSIPGDRKKRAESLSQMESEVRKVKRQLYLEAYHVENLNVLNYPWKNAGQFEKGKLCIVKGVWVTQVLDGDRCRGELAPRGSGKEALFTGVDTSNLVDGKYFETNDLFFVEGPYQYTTVLGASRTVFEVRKLTPNEVAAFEAAAKKRLGEKPLRTWKDKSGKFSVEAALTDFDGKEVELRNEDGTTTKLPIAKLSKQDQAIVQEELGLAPYSR
jgi:hypothetical protein